MASRRLMVILVLGAMVALMLALAGAASAQDNGGGGGIGGGIPGGGSSPGGGGLVTFGPGFPFGGSLTINFSALILSSPAPQPSGVVVVQANTAQPSVVISGSFWKKAFG